MKRGEQTARVAHTSRVLAMASRNRELSLPVGDMRARFLARVRSERLFWRDAKTSTRDVCATRRSA